VSEDYHKETAIDGQHEGTLTMVAVDADGQLYTLMVGKDGHIVAVDADGNMRTIMYGSASGVLTPVSVDASGRIFAQLVGMYGVTAVPIACDSAGRLTIVGLDQTNISADPNEGQTWDASLGTLLNNLNRIRYMCVTITGETWGTVSHSLSTTWGKFHETTGHKHTAVAGDGSQLDHGLLGGLTDDDHARYFDKDGSKALTGANLNRNVDNSLFQMWGSTAVAGKGANFYLTGSNFTDAPGEFGFVVPNAAKSSHAVVMKIAGVTDTPNLDMLGHQITDMADPTSAQHAATRNYVDTSAIAKSGFIILWSGSIASIPSGWVLCNGSASTPDLRDRFVVGAGTTYAVGNTGGEATHTLSVSELAIHSHHVLIGTLDAASGSVKYSASGSNIDYTSGNAGSGSAHENRPPYYALAYIMKT